MGIDSWLFVPSPCAIRKISNEPSDDLGANFNFLASCGLLKKSPPATAKPPSSNDKQGNGPTVSPPSSPAVPTHLPMTDGDIAGSEAEAGSSDTTTTTNTTTPPTAAEELTQSQKLELARAQAKEAQELYDAATVLGNGPV